MDKRNKILCAARAVLNREGFHGATVAKVAKQAGVAAGTVYLHFQDKDDLVVQMLDEMEQALAEVMNTGIQVEGDSATRFKRMWTDLVRFGMANPDALLCWEYSRYLPQQSPEVIRERRQRVFRPLIRFFEQGQANGEIRDYPMPISPIIGIEGAFGLLRLHQEGTYQLTDELIELAADASWHAVAETAK